MGHILLFNRNKFLSNEKYDIKIYFHSIKTNLYSKRNIFNYIIFFYPVNFFYYIIFLLDTFLVTISGHFYLQKSEYTLII